MWEENMYVFRKKRYYRLLSSCMNQSSSSQNKIGLIWRPFGQDSQVRWIINILLHCFQTKFVVAARIKWHNYIQSNVNHFSFMRFQLQQIGEKFLDFSLDLLRPEDVCLHCLKYNISNETTNWSLCEPCDNWDGRETNWDLVTTWRFSFHFTSLPPSS